MRRALALPAVALASALALTGCSYAGSGAAGSKAFGVGSVTGVRTDFGVTASEITLGVLTDSSGPFKSLGVALVEGNRIWINETNAAGGVCGRKIRLEIRDHGYNASKARPSIPG
ncbi:MAG TPA: ABC transporter substrate-binding protein [Pseudonocardiaceae bacterium]